MQGVQAGDGILRSGRKKPIELAWSDFDAPFYPEGEALQGV